MQARARNVSLVLLLVSACDSPPESDGFRDLELGTSGGAEGAGPAGDAGAQEGGSGGDEVEPHEASIDLLDHRIELMDQGDDPLEFGCVESSDEPACQPQAPDLMLLGDACEGDYGSRRLVERTNSPVCSEGELASKSYDCATATGNPNGRCEWGGGHGDWTRPQVFGPRNPFSRGPSCVPSVFFDYAVPTARCAVFDDCLCTCTRAAGEPHAGEPHVGDDVKACGTSEDTCLSPDGDTCYGNTAQDIADCQALHTPGTQAYDDCLGSKLRKGIYSCSWGDDPTCPAF